MIRKKMFIIAAVFMCLILASCAGGGNGSSVPAQGGNADDKKAVTDKNVDETKDVTDKSVDDENEMTGEDEGTATVSQQQEEEASEPEEDEDDGKVHLYKSIASNKGLGKDAICGAAININTIHDEKVMEAVHEHFSAVTLENELKMDCMFGYNNNAPAKGSIHEEELNGETISVPTLDHSRADEMLDILLDWNNSHPENRIRVRGHVLVWHSQAPEWFFHEDYDASTSYVTKDVMDKRLEWYIKSMLEYYTGNDSKYKDMFYGWDVVNEAVSDASGSYRTDEERGNDSLSDPVHSIKSSWWHVYQSNEFIKNAFKYANKYADPEVELYYNDYNEVGGQKIGGIINLIRDVKNEQGTRIDGFGMQGHYSIDSPSPAQIAECARRYGQEVDKVMLTELDVKSSASFNGNEEKLEAEYKKQADYYGAIYEELKKIRQEGIDFCGITVWGVRDSDSWLQTQNGAGGGADGKFKHCPLLFDAECNPKPALFVFTE